LFGIDVDGRTFAAAVWSIDKGAYRSVASSIQNDRKFALASKGLLSVTYGLKIAVVVDEKKGRTRVTPKVKISKHHSEESVTAIKDLLKKVTFAVAEDDSEPLPF